MSLAYRIFIDLCAVTNTFDQLREHYPPGSDGWVALCELVTVLDCLIDQLIDTDGIEEEA